MSANVADIKDRKPNAGTVELLEDLLEKAKEGELRSIILVYDNASQAPANSWSIDHRSHIKLMLGELTVLTVDVANLIGLKTGTSAIAEVLE